LPPTIPAFGFKHLAEIAGGSPLFRDNVKRRDLAVIGTERFGSGAIFERYRLKAI
jgi:hypothetical protein